MDIHALETWYKKNKRDLPFRKTHDPYRIWISEIMLQQTQVDTVIPYYESFIKRFPHVSDLAKADQEQVLKMIEGLGYYRRFRYMKKTAEIIMSDHNGHFPKTYKDLLELPGIGTYTASAIMSIAYNEPYAATDGNVIRVFSREEGIEGDMRKAKNKRKIQSVNQSLIEQAEPTIYTQAMMEIGALICTPKNPACETCPLNGTCFAYQHDAQMDLPDLSKRKPQKQTHYMTLIVEDEDHLFLRKQDEAMLGGLYLCPQYEATDIETVIQQLRQKDIFLKDPRFLGKEKHVFSHRIWHMLVYKTRLTGEKPDDWTRVNKKKLKDVPMPVAHQKIMTLFKANR